MNQEKMMKKARSIDGYVKIFQVLMLVVAIGMVIGIIVVLFAKRKTFPLNFDTIIFLAWRLKLADTTSVKASFNKANVITVLLVPLIVAGIIYYVLAIIRNILRPIQEGRPFESNVPQSIRKLAVLLLLGELITQFAKYLTVYLNTNLFDNFMNLFKDGVVEKVSINHTVSLVPVFMMLLLFLLSYVFEYGMELQRQSDETL